MRRTRPYDARLALSGQVRTGPAAVQGAQGLRAGDGAEGIAYRLQGRDLVDGRDLGHQREAGGAEAEIEGKLDAVEQAFA